VCNRFNLPDDALVLWNPQHALGNPRVFSMTLACVSAAGRTEDATRIRDDMLALPDFKWTQFTLNTWLLHTVR